MNEGAKKSTSDLWESLGQLELGEHTESPPPVTLSTSPYQSLEDLWAGRGGDTPNTEYELELNAPGLYSSSRETTPLMTPHNTPTMTPESTPFSTPLASPDTTPQTSPNTERKQKLTHERRTKSLTNLFSRKKEGQTSVDGSEKKSSPIFRRKGKK